MTDTALRPPAYFRVLTYLIAAGFLLLVSAGGAEAQRRKAAAPALPQEPSPIFHEYRGVQLGMSADEVRNKLGEPKEKGGDQDFYIFNETETAQIVYDKTQKVITISADFMTMGAGVLTSKEVFGAELEPKPDGSVYKMVRYTKAGFWLSFNRTSGTSPLTTVTLQKIQ
jgi:hypothetical protein